MSVQRRTTFLVQHSSQCQSQISPVNTQLGILYKLCTLLLLLESETRQKFFCVFNVVNIVYPDYYLMSWFQTSLLLIRIPLKSQWSFILHLPCYLWRSLGTFTLQLCIKWVIKQKHLQFTLKTVRKTNFCVHLCVCGKCIVKRHCHSKTQQFIHLGASTFLFQVYTFV